MTMTTFAEQAVRYDEKLQRVIVDYYGQKTRMMPEQVVVKAID